MKIQNKQIACNTRLSYKFQVFFCTLVTVDCFFSSEDNEV